jgi:hypothetical protein
MNSSDSIKATPLFDTCRFIGNNLGYKIINTIHPDEEENSCKYVHWDNPKYLIHYLRFKIMVSFINWNIMFHPLMRPEKKPVLIKAGKKPEDGLWEDIVFGDEDGFWEILLVSTYYISHPPHNGQTYLK